MSNSQVGETNSKINHSTAGNAENEKFVLTKKTGAMAVITINRPNKLNSLNKETLTALFEAFKECERDTDIRFVLLEGSGDKAFCAGGDVKAVYERGVAGDAAGAAEVFRLEFDLDYYLANYKKPRIVLMDGITMGGGVGLSISADFRIVTERTRWAMPEMKIGLFPDVGTSYYLSRLKTLPYSSESAESSALGKYLCITSRTVGADDCLYAGLADHKVESGQLETLKSALGSIVVGDISGDELLHRINSIICPFSGGCTAGKPSFLKVQRYAIEKHFGASSIADIIHSLENAAECAAPTAEFAKTTLEALQSNSPTSMAVIIEQHRRAKDLSLKECFDQDYVLVRNFLKNKDFYEGVRTVLIYKTGNPAWSPDDVSHISEETIERYFCFD